MKSLILAIVVLLVSTGGGQAQQQENFTIFFQKFSGDAAFQKSRIKFPLAMVTVDEDNSSTTKTISASKWEFYNIRELKKDKKNIFKVSYPKKDQAIVIRQLEDTGVQLRLVFRFIDNKWQMVQLRDEST